MDFVMVFYALFVSYFNDSSAFLCFGNFIVDNLDKYCMSHIKKAKLIANSCCKCICYNCFIIINNWQNLLTFNTEKQYTPE